MEVRLPPTPLRLKVSNSEDVEEYLMIGSRTASASYHFLGDLGYPLDSFESILDLACGCGRTLNFLSPFVPNAALFACDYDEELVSWCQRNFPRVLTDKNQSDPPLDYRSASFDLVYAISFLTHLPERRQEEWLLELDRVTKDDGLILVTLIGTKLARKGRVWLGRRGFKFKVYGEAFNQHVAYQSREYVLKKWTNLFDVLSYSEGGLNDFQDMVLLGKKGIRRKKRRFRPRCMPKELVDVYHYRDDLWDHFDSRGIGRSDSCWRNLDLLDWALFNGGFEQGSLKSLSYSEQFQVVESA